MREFARSHERSLAFRPSTSDDEEFLYRVYAGTRQEELAATGWSEAEKGTFLRMQFEAQHTHYQTHFGDAHFWVVSQGETPIGRLYVDYCDDEIRIIDIALLPEHRGNGLGTAMMQDILAQGRQEGVPVRIHVERTNPALRLYRRLGFEQIGDTGVYYLMEWTP